MNQVDTLPKKDELDTFNIICGAATLISMAISIFATIYSARVARIVRTRLCTLAGQLKGIKVQTSHCYERVAVVRQLSAEYPQVRNNAKLQERLAWALTDCGAAERQLRHMVGNLLALQESMFGVRFLRHSMASRELVPKRMEEQNGQESDGV